MKHTPVNKNLDMICSIGPSNLAAASCPTVDVHKVDSVLASLRLLDKCDNVDNTNECCNRICQNSIAAAAEKLAFSNYNMKTLSNSSILPDESAIIRDCTKIVLRWLANKLNPSSTNRVHRGLSRCHLNKVFFCKQRHRGLSRCHLN